MHQCSARAAQNTQDNMTRRSMWMTLGSLYLRLESPCQTAVSTCIKQHRGRMNVKTDCRHGTSTRMLKTGLKTGVLLTPPPRPERFSLMVTSLLQRSIAQKISISCLHAFMLHCPDTSVTSAKVYSVIDIPPMFIVFLE